MKLGGDMCSAYDRRLFCMRAVAIAFAALFVACSEGSAPDQAESVGNPQGHAQEKMESGDSKATPTRAAVLDLSPAGKLEFLPTSGPPIPVLDAEENRGLRGAVGRCVSDGNQRTASGWAVSVETQQKPVGLFVAGGRDLKEVPSKVSWNKRPDLKENDALGEIRFQDIGFRVSFKLSDKYLSLQGIRFFVVFENFAEQLRMSDMCTSWLPNSEIPIKGA